MSNEFIASLITGNLMAAIASWVRLNSRVSALEQLADTLKNRSFKHGTELYGNGRTGLTERVSKIEAKMER